MAKINWNEYEINWAELDKIVGERKSETWANEVQNAVEQGIRMESKFDGESSLTHKSFKAGTEIFFLKKSLSVSGTPWKLTIPVSETERIIVKKQ
jgi:hypothetical protein